MILLKILVVTWTIEVIVALIMEHKDRHTNYRNRRILIMASKQTMKTQVNKDIPCKDHIGKPVVNTFGETIGVVTDAVELDTTIELTMEIDNTMAFIQPKVSFEIGPK